MQHHAVDERHELSATLRAVGPTAATLCGDWTATELAAHLVLRERSIAELAGRLPVRQLHRHAERRLAEFVAREPYDRIVATLDRGPAWTDFPVATVWSLPPVRELVNLLEYVVHHEDVRRAVPGTPPRALAVARQRAVWQRLRASAPLTMRAVPVGVLLAWPGHSHIRTGRARVVTVSGDPIELALVAFGRQRVAQVDYDGSPEDVAAVAGARIAL
ncbi:MAG: hypothetical protein JWO57_3634 [Pseudonocardiales bacterium]|nr:hypothetical protein [Pseudonocardiales bacterium]